MPDVNIKYRGNSISTMNATGRKTLTCSGKLCDSNIEVEYTKPATPTPSNLITNGDFSDGTTGWSSLQAQSSIQVSGGKLQLIHNTTSNRNYGVSYAVNLTAGHLYLVHFKLTKSIVDTDSDARGIRVMFGGISGQQAGAMTGITEGTTFEAWACAEADSNQTSLSWTFLGNIATAASNDVMFELWFAEMYDITDIV